MIERTIYDAMVSALKESELQRCHNRYSLRAGVCCHLITLSHFHTLDNKLTLSLIHT